MKFYEKTWFEIIVGIAGAFAIVAGVLSIIGISFPFVDVVLLGVLPK